MNGDSSILVGNKACMIQSNNGTYITCALPQLDQVKSNTQISVEMWGNKFTPILTINIKSDPVITQFLPAVIIYLFIYLFISKKERNKNEI
mgnify:CR=1 FL=1